MALARFDTFIEGLLQREGGYVNHPNDRGGATKYGISSRAHPGLDVANLSKKQASDIYKRDYWDAIGADNLPPRTGEIAADFAINSGVGFAKKALQETGGDPQAMIDYQKQHYANIIKNDPSQQVFEQGWSNRLARLSSAGDASGTGGQVYNAEKPQVQTAQGTVAVDETGQANQGGIENMLAQLEALRPEPMTDMQRMGSAIGEGFARQKPYQGMSAAAGFLNAYGAGQRINAREKASNRAYEMKALQLRYDLEKKEKGTSAMQEYGFAQQQGYKGSFMDYQDRNEEGEDKKGTSQYENWSSAVDGGYKGSFSKWMDKDDVVEEPKFTDVMKLRDKAQSDLDSTRYAASAGRQIQQLISKPGPFSDIAAIYGLVKMLDPESVVREGEVALMSAATSLFDRLNIAVGKIQQGGAIGPKLRENVTETMQELMSLYRDQAGPIVEDYTGVAERWNMNPADITGREIIWPSVKSESGEVIKLR